MQMNNVHSFSILPTLLVTLTFLFVFKGPLVHKCAIRELLTYFCENRSRFHIFLPMITGSQIEPSALWVLKFLPFFF